MGKRKFSRILEGVSMWCGPGLVHVGFNRLTPRNLMYASNTAAALRERGDSWAIGWEGNRLVIGFKSEVGGC